MIAAITVMLVLAASAAVFTLPPQYDATAVVLIDPRTTKVAHMENVLSDLAQNEEVTVSEAQVIQSSLIAGQVINALNLMQTAEINPQIEEPANSDASMAERYRAWAQRMMSNIRELLFGQSSIEPASAKIETASAELVRAKALARFEGRLSVSQIGRSRAISVTYRSDDQVRASQVANAVVDAYLNLQKNIKREASRNATVWLNEQVATLRTEVDRKERQVEEFRAQSGLFMGDRSTLARQQISDLDAQLTKARAQLADAEARYQEVYNVMRSPAELESTVQVMSSPTIQALRRQEAETMQRAAQNSTVLGRRHPEMIKLQAEITDLRSQIMGEVAKIAQQVQREVNVNDNLVTDLEKQLDGVKKDSQHLGEAEVQLRALEREAEANRTLLENFLQRSKETSEQVTLVQPDAWVVSLAQIPIGPAFPKRKLMLAVVLAFAISTGVLIAIALEQMDNTIRSSDQIGQLFGLETLCLLPCVTRRGRRSSASVASLKAEALWDEGLKSLLNSLISGRRGSPRVVLFTSSVPAEGKTTISTALSRFGAEMSSKAIVVDCDMRNPGVHKVLGGDNTVGLSDYLRGRTGFEQIIHHDRASALSFIPAGPSVDNTLPLLRSNRMRSLLAHLKANYDLVILDAPPVLMMADAKCLAEYADATVFVVRWNHERQNIIGNGIQQLHTTGTSLFGVVLNRIDLHRHAAYGFSDSADIRLYRRYYRKSA